MRIYLLLTAFSFALWSCGGASDTARAPGETSNAYETVPDAIERLDPALDQVVSPTAQLEILAEGYDWSEGPLWVARANMLLFSDIPPNSIYKWTPDGGAELYLRPSGYTGDTPRGGEPGSNGLLLDGQGRLVLCQHGDRRLARMDAPLEDPAPQFVTLVDSYQGKRLNSPNDAVFDAMGNLYFTDPPYGLEGGPDSPLKELDFQGVYRLSTDGALTLITDTLSRPNGIGLSPDGSRLYVANSDPAYPVWTVFDINRDGQVSNGRLFVDASERAKTDRGVPDGLKVDGRGNLFATGPGGVWVISPEGKHLGTIRTGQATSNVALDEQGRTLYITADMYLMRMRLGAE